MNLANQLAALASEKLLVHEKVSSDVAAWRMSICEGCEFMDKKSRRCKVCLCYLDAKTKAETNYNPLKNRNEKTHCPKGFWNDADILHSYSELDGMAVAK